MKTEDTKPVHIIGAGMAGSEAAWQCAQRGVPVILHEMRPKRMTEAHQTDGFAELVCSNSFRSDDKHGNAVGVLHEEMRKSDSLIMGMAELHKLPAGGALAVDRDGFSQAVTLMLQQHPLITIEYGEVKGLPPKDWGNTIIATGPLTAPSLANSILKLTGEDSLAFFDAIAPIVYKDSIDFDKAWMQSRPMVKSHAIVQLRQDNALGTLYNMVGFQTKMKYGAQAEILKTIPGLENAVFARLGGIHRNTFINSPILLNDQLQLKARPDLRFAGQIMGVEGYVESAKFQPMNVNFGLFPPIENIKYEKVDGKRLRGKDKTRFRKGLLARRALADIEPWAKA